MYHFFLPGTVDPESHRSTLEWEKHLAISNWHIEQEAIVFRGRCAHHVVHHAIVSFCNDIAGTIAATKAAFVAAEHGSWPFVLPAVVKPDIHAEGYRYVPYRFELDDDRIYRLLMGGAIYHNPLDAVRELIQNAVDACNLRDALTRLTSPEVTPSATDRIVVDYIEPSDGNPQAVLAVQDSGTGMDEWVITRWFLRVGRSYYNSAEFSSHRAHLRKAGLDFAPVSEFGIGFLSCFLLGDQIRVETAMWEPVRGGDTKKRILDIHGPSRLIRLREQETSGVGRFRGTRVSISLLRGDPLMERSAVSFESVEAYLRRVCLHLPYPIKVRHIRNGSVDEQCIEPKRLTVELPPHFAAVAGRIPVNDDIAGLRGEIALIPPGKGAAAEETLAKESSAYISPEEPSEHGRWDESGSALIRGGFRVGSVPGLPSTYKCRFAAKAILETTWEKQENRRFAAPNLSRAGLATENKLTQAVVRHWLSWLLENVAELPEGFIQTLTMHGASRLNQCTWLERFDALRIYQLAKNGWHSWLKSPPAVPAGAIAAWEASQGDALPLSHFRDDLQNQLLDLILPRVSSLSMVGAGGGLSYYVSPPVLGWLKLLGECKNFISKPVCWGPYVNYIRESADLLFFDYPGSTRLNAKYRDRVSPAFEEGEIPSLVSCLSALADSKQQRQVEMYPGILAVAHRAQQTLGDLEIGSIYGSWRIDSYRLPALH